MKDEGYFRKEFIIIFVLVFAISAIFEVIGMNDGYKSSPEAVNQTINWLTETRQTITWFDILTNNIMIAYLSAIPVAGILFYLFVSYNTGVIYGQIGQYYKLTLGQTYSICFTNGIGILEDVSMTLLASESILIVYLLVKDREEVIERLKNHSWKSLIITTLLLLFGALIETWLIRIS